MVGVTVEWVDMCYCRMNCYVLTRCDGRGFDHHTGVVVLHGIDPPPVWWSTFTSR